MNPNRDTLVRGQLALSEAVHRYLYDPNVTMIDFGWKVQGGQLLADADPVVRVHLRRKFPSGPQMEAALSAGITKSEIPDWIAGVRVDRPVAAFRARWGAFRAYPERARRIDPMLGGISISHEFGTYATLGGLVADRNSPSKMILSNWHVLAGYWGARPGQRIYQPGRLDGGGFEDSVARYTRSAMISHHLDAAVAELTDDRRLSTEQFEIGRVTGVGQMKLDLPVIKSGRQTGITLGRVTSVIPGIAKIPYGGIMRLVHNAMRIDPRAGYGEVSAGGDSGSWWLDSQTKNVVGLHFAGCNQPEEYALAMDMQTVLDALEVDVVV